ncbi:MAG: hypothetical protein K2J38_00995 [Muribaculaceae bacterium]|nr:hypothetical protein [Muribaculaceae bacterium]
MMMGFKAAIYRCFLTGYLPAAIVAALLWSCDVHEFPRKSEHKRRLTVELVFEHELPFYQLVEYDRNGTVVRARTAEYERRYVLKAYSRSRGELSRSEEAVWTFTGDSSDPGDAVFDIDMPEGEYTLMVWSDFIDAGSGADKHYITSDFAEISLADRDRHPGSDDTRDAFRGTADVAVTDSKVSIRMERPLAKYTFISTDLDAFLDSRGLLVKEERGVAESDSRDPSRAIDLSSYGVRITYPQYMARSFNMFTNRPADSWVGVSYESDLRVIDGNHAEVGFDYVFVNSHDTSVNVSVEIYDRSDGTVLARLRPVDVPLSRSKHTYVTGPFLTATAGGWAGINPDFEGEFNIWIQ